MLTKLTVQSLTLSYLTSRQHYTWLVLSTYLKHVYYHVRNESPVYVRYKIQDAWGWCMGMIQRDDMGWEVGGGFRIGSSYTPVADSCQCMAKPIQYCKVKLSKNKIKKRKRKRIGGNTFQPLFLKRSALL